MIPAKTRYKTRDGELLAIIEAFKKWQYYLKDCKHKMFMLTNYNNFHCFMEIKNLSSCRVQWVQKLSQYHFQIDYCQDKANGAVDTLSQFPQKSNNEKEKL